MSGSPPAPAAPVVIAAIDSKLIDECVHCGFCLPSCPTYQSWGEEMDSPRGRIYLMKQISRGQLAISDEVAGHFDRCLGCMACTTACPSGVKYDVLIEQTRSALEHLRPRPALERMQRWFLFALFPYPRRLRLVALFQWLYAGTGLQWLLRRSGLLRLLPPQLRQAEALMPPVSAATLLAALPAHTAAVGERRARVALLAGCVQRVYFPEVNRATVDVLAAEGCEVVVPAGAGCCGALSLHVGREQQARALGRRLIEQVEAAQADYLVVNAAGCGSAIKDYARLFADEPAWAERARALSRRTRDVHELLVELGPVATRHPLPVRAAYHDACHLQHAQRVRAQPRALLSAIPGLELLEVPDGDQCCGSAGVYNLLQPESSREVGERKVESVLSLEPALLISANPGCTLQIQGLARGRGRSLPAAHPIEVLAASLRLPGHSGRLG